MPEGPDPPYLGAAPAWAQEGCARLDHYLLGPELGRGGMGKVVEAWDLVLCRRVAIKLLLQTTDPGHLLRFFKEAQAQARLEHPNICRILELGAATDRPYFVMPLIQGRRLGDVRTELGLEDLARIMADVAGAVHAAHRSGLIHRDLKPHNIMVESLADGAWRPVVVDFGLARDLGLGDRTLSWAVVGTPVFMSPEQARGETLGPATDIYSLGATLYSMLAGSPPFEAATLAGLLSFQQRADAPPLRRLLPSVPRDLETIVLKCLEVEPALRYASAYDLEADLRRFLAGEPIMARPITWSDRVWRRVRRNRTLSVTLAVSTVVVVALVGWNLRTRAQSHSQVELAQRFGMEVREVESLLRVERMLPPHDMRPVERSIRAELTDIQTSMDSLGPASRGPGNYALGRGFLALRQYEPAQKHLEAAWNSGYHTPEMASALGTLHAERYALELERAGGLPMGEGRQAVQQAADREHRDPALWFFGLMRGEGMESSALGQARRAILEGRLEDCLIHCEEAIRLQPWRYEALILESQAWYCLALRSMVGTTSGRTLIEVRRLMEEHAFPVLDQAHQLAPSDVEIHRRRLANFYLLAVLDSEGGRPSLAGFRQAEATFEEACRIQPADGALWMGRLSARLRETFVRLAQGGDARTFCREGLVLAAQAGGQITDPLKLEGPSAVLYWLLGEALWRRGEDPRPALAALDGLPSANPIEVAESLNVLARYRGQHGLDPRPQVQRADQMLEDVERRGDGYYYTHTLRGELMLVQASWEWWTGRDPLAAIHRGLLQLRSAEAEKPDCVYPYFHLPLLLALEARVLLDRGQDPGALIAEALRTGRRAVAIRPDHFRSQLALAEAHQVEALAMARRGRVPADAFRSAGKALVDARRDNPTDWRVALAEARLALAEAEWEGGSSETRLLEAERAANRGLRVKPDAPELLWARGEASRLRWAGQGSVPDQALARDDARKALGLCPDLAPAKKLLARLTN